MNILIIDADGGNGQLSFIMRAMEDGHDVKWNFRKPVDWASRPIGKGIATIVTDWRDHVKWADLVIMGDNTRVVREMDEIRRRGVPVIGATEKSAAWELERQLGQMIFKRAGIAVPPYKEFSKYDEAIRYVEKEARAFVSKPNGDTDDKALSYVAKSPADLVYMLKRWKAGHKHKDSFILQEKVSGVEMAVGAFGNGAGGGAQANGCAVAFDHVQPRGFRELEQPGRAGPSAGGLGIKAAFLVGLGQQIIERHPRRRGGIADRGNNPGFGGRGFGAGGEGSGGGGHGGPRRGVSDVSV